MEKELKTRTATWYEVSIKAKQEDGEGNVKKVTHTYAVDSVTFGEAEEKAQEDAMPFYQEVAVKTCKIAAYKEIVMVPSCVGDCKYYVVKIAYAQENDKKDVSTILVQGKDLEDAIDNIKQYNKFCYMDWELVSVSESKVMEVLYNDTNEDAE